MVGGENPNPENLSPKVAPSIYIYIYIYMSYSVNHFKGGIEGII